MTNTMRSHTVMFESLENRYLLAGDFLPGDANMDFYLDEADILQVMKLGKYRTGEEATWEEGDWTGDGVFDIDDVLQLFNPNYVGINGDVPYDSQAQEPIDHFVPIDTMGEPDVTLFYFPVSGTVTAIPSDQSKLGALHIVSKSNSLSGLRGKGPWDFNRDDQQFIVDFSGGSWIETPGLLPLGWSHEQMLADLLIDGAFIGGGDLGTVRLGNIEDFPSERPDDVLVAAPKDPPTFVSEDEANGLLTYDPETGDVLIEAWGLPIEAIELLSPDGLFTGTIGARDRYEERSFDDATPQRFFRLSWDFDGVNRQFLPGFSTVNLPGIAEIGLTKEEFFDGVHPTGVLDPSGRLNLALAIGQTFGECKEHRANGEIVGDANLDGRFNSQDLVTIFQANEYRDAATGNSTWSEGDWTCDGDFDTDDLVAAFQAGQYEAPSAALAIRAYDKSSTQSMGHRENPTGILPYRLDLQVSRTAQRKWLAAGSVDDTAHTGIAVKHLSRFGAIDQIMSDPVSIWIEVTSA